MTSPDLTTAVARAVKAGDTAAELAARAELATANLRRELTGLAAGGVRLTIAQVAELHAHLDRLAGGSTQVRF